MWKCKWLSLCMIFLFLQYHHVAVSSSSNATTRHLSPKVQQLALYQFKLSFTLNTSAVGCYLPWHVTIALPTTASWSMSSDCCTWEGVTCDQMTRDVIELDLSCSQLVGSIPPNSTLFQLSHLQSLNLDHNYLYGVLPEETFHLPNLKQLSVQMNSNLSVILPKVKWGSSVSLEMLSVSYIKSLTSSEAIPDSLGYLKSLTTLSISDCNLSGPIPRSISNLTQLTELHLNNNHFSGQIPDYLSDLQNLTYLSLYDNDLRGQFPSWLCNLRQLETLILPGNLLSGPLPSNITALCFPNLVSLDLAHNLLNGTVPNWLFHHPSLTDLNIGDNEFTGQLNEFPSSKSPLESFYCFNNLLSGTIPLSFSAHVNLRSLDFSYNNFSGVLDIEMFSPIKYLYNLDLSQNSLSVRIKSTTMLSPNLETLGLSSCNITKFPPLRSLENLNNLDLSDNQIDGEIPQWLGLREMYYLNLSQNSLIGGIENLPWNSLNHLDLQSNMLNGTLPTLMCNSSYLSIINLSHNNLSGVLPTCSSLNYTLSVFDLRMNAIRGSLPSSLSNFRELKSLNLYGNKLEGTIPLSFAKLEYLEVLDLGSNQISGTFPQQLEVLQNLQILVLKSNKFHGIISNISTIEHPFPNLRIIDISDNDFFGPLPANYIKNFKGMMDSSANEMERRYMGGPYYSDTVIMVIKGVKFELVRILTVFTIVDLSRNKFEGEIPEYIGNLKSLRYLNLSHNHVSGHIPSTLGKLSMLESLDLSSNRLVGNIPEQLTGLFSLSVLNLSQNDLSGHIPKGYQFNTFENDSYAGNLELCGHPLSKKCEKEIIETQEEEEEEEDDDEYFFSGFTWKAVVIGYGGGVVVGFVVGYMMFIIAGEPKWFTRTVARELRYKVKRIEVR
ncbi:receptor-like protein 35 [Daucus carota subsp. sativus]|uniref:receptor-like protein 35 n=1 Tax=Daucus carota subsp. sativus TaxID=79200 RepID=UPI0007EFDE15|nr:PREDICTED: receptor-like protein 12 [Daucus carota subsp. sativus]